MKIRMLAEIKEYSYSSQFSALYTLKIISVHAPYRTSNVRRFDSLNPRLWKAEVFFVCPHVGRIDLATSNEIAIQIALLKSKHSEKNTRSFM